MLVFHNASDTSYANYAGNLSSMSSTTTSVTLRFLGQGASATATSTDAIVLTVTAGQEERVMEDLAGAMANLRAGMTIVADDQNSKYLVPGITALASISVDNGAGTFKNLIPATWTTADTGGIVNRIIVTNAQSGSEIVVSGVTGADSTIYLPTTPIDGCNFRFTALIASADDTITITAGGAATAFYGVSQQAAVAIEHTGTASAVIADDDFKLGDWFQCTYMGAKWHITGQFDTATSMAVS